MFLSKTNQNITIKALKLLFFGICLIYILNRLEFQSFQFHVILEPIHVVLFILMMVLNWTLETLKWRVLLKSVERQSFWTSFQSILAGLSFGLLTPNRIGNFVGKILYLDSVNRIKGTLFAFFGNYAQLLTTVLFGSVVLFVYRLALMETYSSVLIVLPLLISFLMLLLYFYPSIIAWPLIQPIFSERLIQSFSELTKFNGKFDVLFIAILRHLVFTFQYLIVLAYHPEFDFFSVFCVIQLIFLFTTAIPSLIFGKIVIRESVAIYFLTDLGYQTDFIVSAVLFIWLINIAFPALFGSFFLMIKKQY